MVELKTGCSTQSHLAVFTVVPYFMTLTQLVAHNTPPTWVLLGSCSRNVSWLVRCMYPSWCDSLWGPAWRSDFSSVILWNQVLYKSVLELQPSNFASCFFVQQIWIEARDVNKMTKVFLVVLFQPFSSAALAYQVSVTHIHSSHHRILVDDNFGLLDVLASNPSLDQFFVMSGTRKTNVFLVFLL
jgi:hypothetical protein